MVKFMRKHNIIILFLFALVILLCACNDPVFFAISQEVKPVDPLIKGNPTNFVVYNGHVYVASGNTIHVYNGQTDTDKPYWSKETRPGGNILQITSTDNYLYALCTTDRNNDGKTVIKRLSSDSSWSVMSGVADSYEKIHNIYKAGDILFLYATASSTNYSIFYTILYIDASDTLNVLTIQDPELQNDTGEIIGAAFNGSSYFLATKNKGVYKIDNINSGAYLIESKINFTGIINLEDVNNTIFLIARNGDAYTVYDSIVRIENVSMGKMSTGALAIPEGRIPLHIPPLTGIHTAIWNWNLTKPE